MINFHYTKYEVKKKKQDFLNSTLVFHSFVPHSSMFVQGTKDTDKYDDFLATEPDTANQPHDCAV